MELFLRQETRGPKRESDMSKVMYLRVPTSQHRASVGAREPLRKSLTLPLTYKMEGAHPSQRIARNRDSVGQEPSTVPACHGVGTNEWRFVTGLGCAPTWPSIQALPSSGAEQPLRASSRLQPSLCLRHLTCPHCVSIYWAQLYSRPCAAAGKAEVKPLHPCPQGSSGR